jgi:hypothetical protein
VTDKLLSISAYRRIRRKWNKRGISITESLRGLFINLALFCLVLLVAVAVGAALALAAGAR